MFTTVRGGRCLTFRKHAYEGMNGERPPVTVHDVVEVLEDADWDDGRRALKRVGGRTLIVYYTSHEDELHVRSVSATQGRLAADVP